MDEKWTMMDEFIHYGLNMDDVEWIKLWMKSEQWWLNFHPSNEIFLLWMKIDVHG